MKKKEITSLLITLLVIKMLLAYPISIVKNSGQAAWIEVLYASVIAIFIFFITTKVYRVKKDIIEIAESIGGKPLRIIIGLVVFFTLFINFTAISRVYPESVKVILLQNMRIEWIITGLAVITVFGAYMGMNSISRVNFMFLPIAGIIFLGFLILLIPYYKFENIMPVLGEGAKPIFLNGIKSLAMFSDILILNLLIPRSKNFDDANSGGMKGIIISAIVSFIIVAAFCLTYEYPASSEYLLPMYQLTKMIHISNFFSRFESFFQFIWSILLFLYSAAYVHIMCDIIRKTFSLKYSKPLIIPIVLLGSAIGRIPSSIADTVSISNMLGLIQIPIVFLLPIIFGAVGTRRYRRKK